MRRVTTLVCMLGAVLLVCRAGNVHAQGVDAVAGEPFGVGIIRVDPDPAFLPPLLGPEGLSVTARDGRILYPAIQAPPDTSLVQDLVLDSPWMQGGPIRQRAGGLLRGLLNQPAPTTVYFLFRGDEPLQVTLEGRTRRQFEVQPRQDPYAHAALLAAWWGQYSAKPGGLFASTGQFPPCASNYLQAMLARRLKLLATETQSGESWQNQLEGQLGFFLGTEEVRLAIARDRMLGRFPAGGEATQPMPESPQWPPLELPEPAADVKIEPIAHRVPPECLYVRFGTFANFLWLQDTLKLWGGDLGNLVALRGLDKGQSRRMEQQLILKQTALSRLLGPTVISDVAVIGTDMFLREGAAYGILFEARNAFLEADLRRQRKERLAQGDVAEKMLKIAGHDVSLITSPDGSVRSLCVADKGYVFVTTSETLVRRFLETTPDGPSLARQADFRHARSLMPLSRQDTVFIYLSDAFFRNMTGPQYWIESYRRLQATADLQLAEMASLASATEGRPGDTIDALVSGGFLSAEFGPRPDGSRTLLVDGDAVDSLRGRRGYFVPIPDVPVTSVSPDEAAAYAHFVEFCHAEWGRFDPMIVGIRRYPPKDHVERVVLDVLANPLARRHFEMLSERIGPPNNDRLAPIPGDRLAMEVQLSNQRLFGAIRDPGPEPPAPYGESPRLLGSWRNLLVGYIGTTGPAGFLGLLDRRIGAPPGAPGLAGQPGRLWRHQSEPFTVFSFHPGILNEVVPQLRFVPADRLAQIRLHVGDISQGRLTSSLTTMSYYRTRSTTLGNLRLMHAMSEQLHVPRPDAKEVAEFLLDARLVCPLGGKYEYRERPDGSGYWTSTALDTERDGPMAGRVPEGFTVPPMSWFRGLDADVAMTPRDLSAHVEVLMRLPDKPLVSEPESMPPPEEVPAPDSSPPTQAPPSNPNDRQPVEKPAEKPSDKPANTGGWLEGILRPKPK